MSCITFILDFWSFRPLLLEKFDSLAMHVLYSYIKVITVCRKDPLQFLNIVSKHKTSAVMVGTFRYGWDKRLFGSVGDWSLACNQQLLFHRDVLRLR